MNQTEEEIRAISHLDKVISVQKGDEDDNGGGGEGALDFPFSITEDILGKTRQSLLRISVLL